MTDVINIKDFYNHDTRISLLEKIAIDNNQFNQDLRADMKDLRADMKEIKQEAASSFKWTIGIMLTMISISTSTILAILFHLLK